MPKSFWRRWKNYMEENKSNYQRSFSVLGNIAIVNFPLDMKKSEKVKFAKKIVKENKSVKTILEKSGKFKGRLRKQRTTFIFGEKNKEVLYRENNCVFRFDVDETYFSPRLSNERKEVSDFISKGEKVLVMCAGVGPFSIVIAKNSFAEKVYSNEINRKANKYAKLNIERNKLKNKVELVPGDIKKVAPKLKDSGLKFDSIVMARPQLKDSFLDEAFMVSKKGTKVFYYDFCIEDEIDSKLEMVKQKAKENKKKIKILNVKKAGNIGPYKYRIRIDFIVL
jgi:tRNA (guanine37-N1)-methyltransferase